MADDLIDFGGGGAQPDAPGAGGDNAPAMSVSELSGRLKRSLEDAFGRVRVRGEIGRVSRPRSGHVYLDLKDDRAVLSGVIWRGVAAGLKAPPEEGLEVVAEGRLTTFPGQSKYQIVIESLTPAGAGALMAMLEERKARLAAEGLFAPERKRAPPFLPEVVGVVTSPSGAVIRDILHRLSDRFPRRVLIWPVAVQGDASAREVAAAIQGFNALARGGAVPRPDVLIVARGGGSIEDLWSFNEEIVVRAAAASDIPLISAVGHETDTTLIDFASDRRAPTPTAAAEMAVPVRAELMAGLAALQERRLRAQARLMEERRRRLRDLRRALPRPDALLGPAAQRLDAAASRLPRALLSFARGLDGRLARLRARIGPRLLREPIRERAERARGLSRRLGPALARRAAAAEDGWRSRRLDARLDQALRRRVDEPAERLARLGRLLESLSYKATLSRGYAAVRGPTGVLARAEAVPPGARLELEFADGRVAATADGASGSGGAKDGAPAGRRPRRAKKAAVAASSAGKDADPGPALGENMSENTGQTEGENESAAAEPQGRLL